MILRLCCATYFQKHAWQEAAPSCGGRRGAAVTESVLSGGGEERRARSAVEEAGSALSREPGRLLMRSVGEGCVRRMRRVRDKGRR